MNLIEWTVRLGICSLEEAIGSEWRNRERGIPRRHVEFNPQAAWEELTHPAAGQFASTLSRSIHFNNPILRLVQLYLDYNLLGLSNSAVRTSMTELYLMWCARRDRRVYLGFWTAYQCHLIATHPTRNLTLCHILGAFVRSNIAMIETERLSPMFMVDPPGLFDIQFFTCTNTVYIREGVPHFYAMSEAAIPAGRVIAGQAGQVQEQRQTNLERAVAELAAENREARTELTRLADGMEGIFKEMLRNRKARKTGTSGQTSRRSVPQEPEEEDDEQQEPEEEDNKTQESEEDESEAPETVPDEPTAQSSTLRRSQWKR